MSRKVDVSYSLLDYRNAHISFAGGGGSFHEEVMPHVKDREALMIYGDNHDIDFRVHADCGDARLQKADGNYWYHVAPSWMSKDNLVTSHSEPTAVVYPLRHPLIGRIGSKVICMDNRYPENEGRYVYTRGNTDWLVKDFGKRVGISDRDRRDIFRNLEERTVQVIRKLVDPRFDIPLMARTIF